MFKGVIETMSLIVNEPYFEKYPGDLLDYTINWGDYWLGDDKISGSSWTIPAGLSTVATNFDDDKAVAWISGGTVGQLYELTNRIVTGTGRIANQKIVVGII